MRSLLRVKIESVKGEVPEKPRAAEFRKSEITIGRTSGNDFVIPDSSVSGEHARLIVRESPTGGLELYVKDCNSSNGTFLAERRLPANEEILVEPGTPLALAGIVVVAGFGGDAELERFIPKRTKDEEKAYQEELKIRQEIHTQIIGRLDLRKRSMSSLANKELRKKAEGVVDIILKDLPKKLPKVINKTELVEHVLGEALGLGPIEALLENEDCTEVLVNSFDRIYAEIDGSMQYIEGGFSGEEALTLAIERLLAPTGRQIDNEHPMVDVRLKDGSRVSAVVRPLALNGPCVTIRKPANEPLTAEQLVRNGTLSGAMSDFLKLAAENRLNVVIAGGTGSGKTTMLNMLAGYIPHYQRVITVEEAAELRLEQEHFVGFQTRPPDECGTQEIGIRDLIQNALFMRPDRVIIGDCKGDAVLDVLEVMHAGHDGSMTSGLANTPEDMLRRLETMVLATGLEMPPRAVREQIAGAFNLVVQLTRFPDGSRRVTSISEVAGMNHDTSTIILRDIYRFRQKGLDENGKLCGQQIATGHIPRFIYQLQEEGHEVDMTLFGVEDEVDSEGEGES